MEITNNKNVTETTIDETASEETTNDKNATETTNDETASEETTNDKILWKPLMIIQT